MKPTKEDLVTRYVNLVYYFAIRWANKPDVDDIVQETYVRAFKAYDAFRYTAENQLKSWLLTICRNVTIDIHALKRNVVHVEEIQDISISEQDVDSWLAIEIQKEDIARLNNEFNTIPSIDRDILRLRFYENLSFKDIGNILQVPVPAAKMRCYRALNRLKEKLI